MGIDGIGKGPGGVPNVRLPEESVTGGAGARPAAPFSVENKAAVQVEAQGVAPTSEVAASPALDGVKNGTLDVHGYVEAKVHEATAHLAHLSPAQLEGVRSILREQLTNDPHLAELVEQATGHALPPPDDT